MRAFGLPAGGKGPDGASGSAGAPGGARRSRAGSAAGPYSDAPDVVVFAEPSLAPALREVGRSFRERTGAPVRVFGAPGFALAAEVARGARSDVLVLASGTMDKVEQSGLLLPGARRARFTTQLVIAAAAGGKPLQPLSAETLQERLGDRRFACPDQTIASPIDGRAVLQRLGLGQALSGRIIGGALNADVAFYLLRNEAALGLLFLADARAAGLPVAALLPPAPGNPACFEAAVTKIRRSRFAHSFLDFLRSSVARSQLAAAGIMQA